MSSETFSPLDARSADTLHQVRIFPTGGYVPENLLRIHVFFNSPGLADQVLSAFQLLDSAGNEVPHPFLDLSQGLWDPSGTRLTLLLHPGRIKSGLNASQSMGTALHAYQNYSLLLNMRMLLGDAYEGVQSYSFTVLPAITSAIDIASWRLNKPAEQTYDALEVSFDRCIDISSLDNSFVIQDSHGAEIPHTLSVSENEKKAVITPHSAWLAGRYTLLVSPDLEDVAGNQFVISFESAIGTGENSSQVDFAVDFSTA
jgi:Bacterial Ig-like domain